jgi:predicted sugar kinase
MRINSESAFEVTRRLDTFLRNASKFGSKQKIIQNQLSFKTKAEAEQYMIDTYFHGKSEYGPGVYGIALVDENNQPRDINTIHEEINKAVLGGLNL